MNITDAWTDADAAAARLALELECLLIDTKDTAVQSRWWDSAHEALELHRKRMSEERATSPTREPTDAELMALMPKPPMIFTRSEVLQLMRSAREWKP